MNWCENLSHLGLSLAYIYKYLLDAVPGISVKGSRLHLPAAGGGHIVAPLYFCDDIAATRRDREAKVCTHLPEYLAQVVSKFGVD